MKWSAVVVGVFAAAFLPEASAEAMAKDATKDIQLDTNLIPTWSDLGTKSDTQTIRLTRVKTYWDALQARDKKAIEGLYSWSTEGKQKDKVNAYFDSAATCYDNQKDDGTRKSKAVIAQLLAKLSDCVKLIKAPTFTVDTSKNLPTTYYDKVTPDYSAEDKTDAYEDARKEIQLDTNIVPTWSDLGTKTDWQTIRLSRVKTYWDALKARDKKAIDDLYSYWDQGAQKDKVDDFYSGAIKCYNKQTDTDKRKSKNEIEQALKSIADCVETVVAPKFTILITQNLPPTYYDKVTADFSAEDKKDADEDAKARKDIQLDTNIIPTWSDLGTKSDAQTIRLTRVKTYWDALEARDKKQIDDLYSWWDQGAQKDKVKDFYNGAAKCLNKQTDTDKRKSKEEIEKALKAIADCVKAVAPPTFSILVSQNLPSTYYNQVTVDFSDDDKKDADEDAMARKDVQLDTDIVPTWSELGTKSTTQTIRLTRVKTYWDALEDRDKAAIKELYWGWDEWGPLGKVDDFYNGAVKCLDKQTDSDIRKSKEEIEQALKTIADCVKTINAPTFSILVSQNLPSSYFEKVNPDYSADDKKDEDEDARKKIQLDANIVPTWNDLGTKASTKKIRLTRVSTYWGAREERDKRAIQSLYPSVWDDYAATAKVTDFYNGATKCLQKQKELELKTREQVDQALSEIAQCIQETVTPPTFSVLKTQSLPTNYFDVVQPDYSNNDKEEAAEEAAEVQTSPAGIQEVRSDEQVPATSTFVEPTQVTTTNEEPTPHTGPSYSEPEGAEPLDGPLAGEFHGEEHQTGAYHGEEQPFEEPPGGVSPGHEMQYEEPLTGAYNGEEVPEDAVSIPHELHPEEPPLEPQEIVEDESPEVIAGLARSPSMWLFSPTSEDVPPLWALDLDHSHAVSLDEWFDYIKRLRGLATHTASAGRDALAVGLLHTIIDFHYDTLSYCINQKLQMTGEKELENPEYSEVSEWIEANCYVKFRYSLFAGVPPFEWIAKDLPTVPVSTIEQWFSEQVKKARNDLKNVHLMSVTPDNQELVEKFIACTYATLKQADNTPVNRGMYYGALHQIEECVHH